MNQLELLLITIQQYNEQATKLENIYEEIINLDKAIQKQQQDIQHKRVYLIKYPLNIMLKKKYMIDDVTNPQELERYHQNIQYYNQTIEQEKAKRYYVHDLRERIANLAHNLTFNDCLAFWNNLSRDEIKENYLMIKDKLKPFKKYLPVE